MATTSEKPEFINLNVHKAGLDGLNQERINEIIQEASKGSNFYTFQQKRQQRIDNQIKKLKLKASQISNQEKVNAQIKANDLLFQLEQERILNRIIVHFDMDMFFAAVEIKKDPSLAEKPMAVGSMAMISTSNYLARKYGVRSAMAGFIAKKLCPQLTLIKPNFKHYCQESECVMSIIKDYYPDLRTYSLDEAYIDLTDYVFRKYSQENDVSVAELSNREELEENIWQFAYNIVGDIRTRIHAETKLTVSAGISCNTRLAKICTDINKPNGQFMIKGYRKEIMEFVSQIEIRKFTGIGPVRGQLLAAFDVIKGSDIFTQRALLWNLFSELNVNYFFKIYLGIGSAHLKTDDDYEQKSHSREKTVGEICEFRDICDVLLELSIRISKDLKYESQLCKTITLKMKKTSFEVFIKCRTIDKFTDNEQTIFNVAKELLSQEMIKSPNQKYRLIGLRASNLLNNQDVARSNQSLENQPTLSQFFKQKNVGDEFEQDSETSETRKVLNNQCVLCDQIFEDFWELEMHKTFCEGDLEIIYDETLTRDSNEFKQYNSSVALEKIAENDSDNKKSQTKKNQIQKEEMLYLKCPICQSNTLFIDNAALNSHIDICLNRQLCIELTKVEQTNSSDSDLSLKTLSKQQTETKTIRESTETAKRLLSHSAQEQQLEGKMGFLSNKKQPNNKKKRCFGSTSGPSDANQKRIDDYFHH